MFRRERRSFAMAPVVSLPSGNVAVVSLPLDEPAVQVPLQASAADPDGDTAGSETPAGWSIRSADGTVLRAGLPDRASASRLLGVLAAHGAALPLIVHGPDGQPAGERLG